MYVLERIRAYADTDRTALVNRGETLSYRELHEQSDAFAAYLLDTLGNDRAPVIIYGHKETAFLPCIYGCLKSGRAYVPVDTAIPYDRLREIIDDTAPCLIVDFSGLVTDMDRVVLAADMLVSVLHHYPRRDIPESTWITGEQVAYILFTSGSMGRPKGVPITVNNLAHFYRGLLPHMPPGEGGVILNQISYSFDVSCCALYVGISRGMALFTIDHTLAGDMRLLFDALKKSELTYWVSTPSFAELCMQSDAFSAALLPKLTNFLFCGEVLIHKLCAQIAERFPAASVLNTYGPTEATVLVTTVDITRTHRESDRPIPIGVPIEGIELRIVNEAGEPIEEDGAAGELVIVGESVGPGYHKRPELTESRFFTDTATGRRGYRTGDICYRQGGLYYYSGRVDNQLKIGGFRIEVEDIEHNLSRLPGVTRAAVVPVWADGRPQYLVAFVLMQEDDGLTALGRTIKLKKLAADRLPAYMIPRRFVTVDAFPLNVNGKIDKKALSGSLQGDRP